MTLLARDINKTKDATRRSEMIDSLLMLNDVRAQYYPRYAVAALNTKGQYITQFFKDPKVVYDRLDEIIATNQENTKPSLLLLKLNSAIDLFKADKLGAEEVINTYQNAIALSSPEHRLERPSPAPWQGRAFQQEGVLLFDRPSIDDNHRRCQEKAQGY